MHKWKNKCTLIRRLNWFGRLPNNKINLNVKTFRLFRCIGGLQIYRLHERTVYFHFCKHRAKRFSRLFFFFVFRSLKKKSQQNYRCSWEVIWVALCCRRKYTQQKEQTFYLNNIYKKTFFHFSFIFVFKEGHCVYNASNLQAI